MMDSQTQLDTETLAGEIVRYLGVVDAFRSLGCEPRWRPELPSADASTAKFVSAAESARRLRRRLGPPRFTV